MSFTWVPTSSKAELNIPLLRVLMTAQFQMSAHLGKQACVCQLHASHGKKSRSPWCIVRQHTGNYRLISKRNMALVKGIISVLPFLINTWRELEHIYESSKRQKPPASPKFVCFFFFFLIYSWLFFPNDLAWSLQTSFSERIRAPTTFQVLKHPLN